MVEPSKIFKESLSIADLTEGKIVKYRPGKLGERGGIIVTIKSEPLEAFIYELSKPRARENPKEAIPNLLEAPEVYVPLDGQNYGKHWGSEVPFTYDGQYFTPSFQPMPSLIGPNATFNLYMMRSVGLSKGVTWKYEGVYGAKECEIFTEMWEKTMERIYQQIFKGLEVTISIVPGVAA